MSMDHVRPQLKDMSTRDMLSYFKVSGNDLLDPLLHNAEVVLEQSHTLTDLLSQYGIEPQIGNGERFLQSQHDRNMGLTRYLRDSLPPEIFFNQSHPSFEAWLLAQRGIHPDRTAHSFSSNIGVSFLLEESGWGTRHLVPTEIDALEFLEVLSGSEVLENASKRQELSTLEQQRIALPALLWLDSGSERGVGLRTTALTDAKYLMLHNYMGNSQVIVEFPDIQGARLEIEEVLPNDARVYDVSNCQFSFYYPGIDGGTHKKTMTTAEILQAARENNDFLSIPEEVHTNEAALDPSFNNKMIMAGSELTHFMKNELTEDEVAKVARAILPEPGFGTKKMIKIGKIKYEDLFTREMLFTYLATPTNFSTGGNEETDYNSVLHRVVGLLYEINPDFADKIVYQSW